MKVSYLFSLKDGLQQSRLQYVIFISATVSLHWLRALLVPIWYYFSLWFVILV